MPQITQLPLIFFSQLFWLLVVFAILTALYINDAVNLH